jgi:hypothetical protein
MPGSSAIEDNTREATTASDSESREGSGVWKDERRSPGYLPQGRRAPYALAAIVAFTVLWRVFLARHIPVAVLSPLVILIGLSSFWVAARMDEQRLQQERYARGPGWWLGWLVSRTSVSFARGFYVVLGILICLLGLAALL